jgi:hypothetical protein
MSNLRRVRAILSSLFGSLHGFRTNHKIKMLRGIEFCQRVRKVSSEIRKALILDLGPIGWRGFQVSGFRCWSERSACDRVMEVDRWNSGIMGINEFYQILKETHRDSICLGLTFTFHCSSSRLISGSSLFLNKRGCYDAPTVVWSAIAPTP